MQIALAINATNEAEARDLARRAAGIIPQGGWLHLDVADGIYTSRSSWGDASQWPKFAQSLPGIELEVHLMAHDWENRIGPWLAAGAKRIIVQAELLHDAERLTELMKKHEAQAMLSVAPHIPVASLIPHYAHCRAFQILAVPPGDSGQTFDTAAIGRLRAVRAACPDAMLEADGGVTPEVLRAVKAAGANVAVSSSYIWKSADPKAAYEELTAI